MGDTVLTPATSTATSTAGAPVDLARLNELTAGDTEFAMELIDTFIESGVQVMLEVRAALAESKPSAVSRAAHKLKGACANIHAEALRTLAHSLETHASSLDRQQLEANVARMGAEFERVTQFLKEQQTDGH